MSLAKLILTDLRTYSEVHQFPLGSRSDGEKFLRTRMSISVDPDGVVSRLLCW